MSRAGRFALVIPQMLTEKGSSFVCGHFYCLTMYSIKSVICFSVQPMLRRYSIIRLIALSLKDSIPYPFYLPNFELFGFTIPDILSRIRSLSGNLRAHRPREIQGLPHNKHKCLNGKRSLAFASLSADSRIRQ